MRFFATPASRRYLGVAAAAGAASSSSAASAAAAPTPTPLFRFGLIADVQYADIDDATNFSGDSVRNYRSTLETVKLAVAHWNAQSDPAPRVVAQRGDLIDGQNAGKYGQGLAFEEPQSFASCARLLDAFGAAAAPVYHAIGNHELYNFSWDALRSVLNGDGSRGQHVATDSQRERFHFSFRPARGWVFIMLNPYEVSMLAEEGSPHRAKAHAVLTERNPNSIAAGQGTVDYFAGLSGDEMRFVPFNGAASDVQLKWLAKELQFARRRNERVVVMTHLPINSDAASWRTTAWNAPEIVETLHREGRGNVVAVLAGHHHKGGYAVDACGVHHVTVQSPLENNGLGCFGTVDVHHDRLELVGHGALPSRTLVFPPLGGAGDAAAVAAAAAAAAAAANVQTIANPAPRIGGRRAWHEA
jgi:manganese-dependent ADP-ribose/CDP-alcohol diphosphatase